MRRVTSVIGAGLLAVVLAGCKDNTPPPPRVPVPTSDNPHARRESDPIKPLPPPRHNERSSAAPFYDKILASQRPPEPRAFVETCCVVGQPSITVFVNRGLHGQTTRPWTNFLSAIPGGEDTGEGPGYRRVS